jgi:hypothetical protein
VAKTQYRTTLDTSVYIDTEGAEDDKREIDRAIADIDKALEKLRPGGLDASIFQGNIYDSTHEDMENMWRRLSEQRRKCVDMKNDITNIVNHYVTLDREIRRRALEVFTNG